MADLILPGTSDLALALREPALLVPGRKPVGAVRVNRSRLAGASAHNVLLLGAHGRSALDVASGKLIQEAAHFGTFNTVGTKHGIGANVIYDSADVGTAIYQTSHPVGWASGWVLLFSEFTGIGTSTTAGWWGIRSGSTNTLVFGDPANTSLTFRINGNSQTISTGSALEDGKIHAVLFAWSQAGSYRRIYVDGALAGENTTAFTWADGTSGVQEFWEDSDQNSGAAKNHGIKLLAASGVGVLPDSVARGLTRNPFALLEPANSTPYIFPIAGGGGVTLTGTPATIAFAGVQGAVGQAAAITGAAGAVAFSGVQATVAQPQLVTGTAGELAVAGVSAVLMQEQLVTGNAGTVAFAGVQAAVTQAGVTPIEIAGTAGTVSFTGVQGVVGQAATVTGAVGTVAFTGVAGAVEQPLIGSAGVLAFSGVQGAVVGTVITNIVGSAGTLAFTGAAGAVAQATGAGGGRLIRRRSTRTPYWDDDEALSALLFALGKHPAERTQRDLRAAAKEGLTELLQTQPVAVEYDKTGAMMLDVLGKQIRLQGALRRHVEDLKDEDDLMEIIRLVA